MPKYWLASKPAPDPPVLNWLKWSGHDLERHFAKSDTIGAIIGLASTKWATFKQSTAPSSFPMLLHLDLLPSLATPAISTLNHHSSIQMQVIGLIMVVVTYDDIPLKLRPEEHLSLRTVADTSWASAKVKLGMVQSPINFLWAEDHFILCARPQF
jgi:hypothetical protein